MDFLRKHKKTLSNLIFVARIYIRYYEEIESSIYYLIGLIYKRSKNESIQM